MKKIGLILIGLMIICNVGAAWADPTVKEILQKKIDTDNSISTFESKILNEWYYPEGNKIVSSNGYTWRKGKDRYKLVIYDEYGAEESTTISNDTATYMSNQSGKYVLDKKSNGSGGTATPSEDATIGDNIDKLLEYYSGSIKSNNSDVYTIEMVPTVKSQFYNQVKVEEIIDYSTGVEIKRAISDNTGNFITSTEISDISQIDGIWFGKTKTVKTLDKNNIIIINIIKYEDVKINQNIEDNLFDFAIPGGGN